VRGVAFDVTELRQAEERLRLVVDSTPMALLMIDREGQIVLANARAASYFGFPTDGLVGRRIEAMVPEAKPTGTEFQSSSLADSRRRTALADGELQAQRLDGSVFPVEVSVAQISDGARELYLVSVVDVSDRTRVEATLARQRSELAHLSRVTVLGELSASIAHELNQPLAAILANAQTAQRLLTRDRVDLDELREILDDVVADDKRAGEVIRGLRSMLRKEEQVHVPLQINEVVEEVLQIVRSDLIHRRVAVELELASRLPQVAGDRVQLQQVLLNLILNGCEAMSGEPLARLLSIRTVAGATGEVEVTITDRGAGVPAHVADRLFEPFVTTKPQGTGLGLAVCRTIVGAHHGRISVTNDAGAGATARVVLPALRESALTRTAGARAAPS
jgi:two-component system sensor kinase FixL